MANKKNEEITRKSHQSVTVKNDRWTDHCGKYEYNFCGRLKFNLTLSTVNVIPSVQSAAVICST